MAEEKEVKVNVRFTIVNLLNYAAVAAVVLGVVIGITVAVGSDYATGPIKFASFLENTLYGIFFGGVLAGFAELVKSKS